MTENCSNHWDVPNERGGRKLNISKQLRREGQLTEMLCIADGIAVFTINFETAFLILF